MEQKIVEYPEGMGSKYKLKLIPFSFLNLTLSSYILPVACDPARHLMTGVTFLTSILHLPDKIATDGLLLLSLMPLSCYYRVENL